MINTPIVSVPTRNQTGQATRAFLQETFVLKCPADRLTSPFATRQITPFDTQGAGLAPLEGFYGRHAGFRSKVEAQKKTR